MEFSMCVSCVLKYFLHLNSCHRKCFCGKCNFPKILFILKIFLNLPSNSEHVIVTSIESFPHSLTILKLGHIISTNSNEVTTVIILE